jgi:hypothetical protein
VPEILEEFYPETDNHSEQAVDTAPVISAKGRPSLKEKLDGRVATLSLGQESA